MKKIYLLLSILISSAVRAQYCTPAIIPYAPTMPGITHFVLNTIDRVSGALEHTNSGFVTTGLSTTLTMGQTYSISISHNIDASICPDMNIRVWIDYNHDGQLDDVGETVVSINHHLPGTYTTTFTVPAASANVLPGITRMRATVKMSDIGGHSLPTPCDNPPDGLGYHGEMEDYTVNLVAPTGINELDHSLSSLNVFPNPAQSSSSIEYELSKPANVMIELFNDLGEKVADVVTNENQPAGKHAVNFQQLSSLNNGLYIIKLIAGDDSYLKTVVLNHN